MTNVIFNHLTPGRSLDEQSLNNPQEIFGYFTEFLGHFEEFSKADLSELEQYWKIRVHKKNDLLFSEAEPMRELSFIVKGAVKLYKEHLKGNQILALLTEANFTAQKKTFCHRDAAPYNAICIEPTVLLSIDCEHMKQLLADRPVFASYFAEQSENIIHFLQSRMTGFQLLSAQERYEEILDSSPDLISRFTLTDIANYLGMKGETLSRVRSSLSKKDLKIAS